MRKLLIYIILFILGTSIIVVVFAMIGFNKIWTNLLKVGDQGIIIYLVVTFISLSMTGLGWWLVLRSHKIRISAFRTAIAHLIGFGINLFVPSFYIAGEPFRAYYIGRVYNVPKNDVFATAIFAKFIELLAFLLFLCFGTAIIVLHPQCRELVPAGIGYALIGIDMVIGLVLIFSIWSIIHNLQLITKLLRTIKKIGIWSRFIEKAIPQTQQMEEITSAVFRHNWKIGIVVMLLSIISVGITFFKPVIIFYFLWDQSQWLSLPELALIFTVGQILLSFHLTPGGAGILEGGQLVTFQYINIMPDIAAAYLVIVRSIDFIIAGLGCYLMLYYNILWTSETKETNLSTIEKITTITKKINLEDKLRSPFKRYRKA